VKRTFSALRLPLTWAYAMMLVVGMTGLASAQGDAVPPGSARQQLQRIHTPQSIDDELARLSKDLELTPDQQQRVRPLLQEHHDKLQALFERNPAASRQDLGSQIHAISDETHREIHAMLSDRQRELENAMQQREHAGAEQGAKSRPA
jgi:Spy/CpxP family protein refolding chaperone